MNKNSAHRIIIGILATVFNILTINYLDDWMMIKMSRQKKSNDVTHIFRQLQRILVDLQIKKNLYLNPINNNTENVLYKLPHTIMLNKN